ncbi:lipid-A-disaccharide synthase [Inquilinus sp. CAU 1745]|uniref:lipid-A-disaccharide synthase n=1 Tax=Inquilinus sp. CAU 1745 TaxID=3140369 RepID=UPI00325B9127
MTSKLVFLIAGEPSGDVLGARLMASLKRAAEGEVRFAGVGGERMQAEGLDSLFPMEELSVMGIAEVLPRLRSLTARIGQTARTALDLSPDIVITIDAPGFNFRVGRKLRGRTFPLVHYVAPTVWAWRPGRAKKIARFLDHLLVLLPFEPPYFEREGLSTSFVGHPVTESGADSGDGDRFRAIHGIPEDAPLLCVLPGSRRSETSRLLEIFGATVDLLASRFPDLRIVVPTVSWVAGEVSRAVANWAVPTVVVRGDEEKYDAFAAADAGLAASGTVALELAMAGLPSVIGYKMQPATAWIAKRLIRVKYANLVNILLDRPAVPEFLQDNCRPELLAEAIGSLLSDPDAAARQRQDARTAVAMLRPEGQPTPSDAAAAKILELMK